MLRATTCRLRFAAGDNTVALECGEMLPDGIICNAESFRQVFDGKAGLILEKQSEQLLLSKAE